MPNLDDKLMSILDTPLGFDIWPKDVVLSENDKNDEEEFKDGRLGITKSHKKYRDDLVFVHNLVSRARAVGLDHKFAEIYDSAIDRTVGTRGTLTRAEMEDLLTGLAEEEFEAELLSAERAQKDANKIDPSTINDPELRAAIDRLTDQRSAVDIRSFIPNTKASKNKPAVRQNQPLTVWQLINPREIDASQTLTVRYSSNGKLNAVTFDVTTPIDQQLVNLFTILNHFERNDLKGAVIRSIKDCMLVLAHALPQLPRLQRQYTATYYSVRTIADKLHSDIKK